MAMEVRRVITSPDGSPAHDGHILCVAYNPLRREIFTGSQDTKVKTWVAETGEFVRELVEHKGWVTGLAFSPELKVLFSCSIDGRVLVWHKADLLQKERVGDKANNEVTGSSSAKPGPLHCLAWDSRRRNLVVGANGQIWVYAAIPETEMNPKTKVIIRLQSLLANAHVNAADDSLVRGIICTENGKLYSVGYDRKLCMWDTDSTRALKKDGASAGGSKSKRNKTEGDSSLFGAEPKLKRVGEPVLCHDAAISAVAFDPDNNWVITGSYDRKVKVWASDAKKPVAEIDEKGGIDDTVTGLAYCPATKTLWMASNSPNPLVYDPRSATDITPYLQQSDTSSSVQRDSRDRIQKLFRIAQGAKEEDWLVGSTSSRNLLIWRYNPHGACSILRAHTDWVEVLTYAYKRQPSAELSSDASDEHDQLVMLSGGADSTIRQWEPISRMNPFLYHQTDSLVGHSGAVLCALYCEATDAFVTGGDDGTIRLWPLSDDMGDAEAEMRRGQSDDAGASAAAGGGKPQGPVLLSTGKADGPGHLDRVTGLVCYGSTVGSCSWDLSLRLWDLPRCLSEVANGEEPKPSHVILDAHDDYILGMAYAPELEQIASASADQGVKLWDATIDTEPTPLDVVRAREQRREQRPEQRPFDKQLEAREVTIPEGRKGKQLCGTLTGHASDVSHIKWNAQHMLWVSGSEDHTVRLWSTENRQVGEIRPPGEANSVTAVAIDARGFILVASMDRAVRVYDPRPSVDPSASWPYDPEIVQQHLGHADAVRCILHVPQKQQYLTASWDRTVRVWRDYEPPLVPKASEAAGDEGEEGEEGEEAADALEPTAAAPAAEEAAAVAVDAEEEYVPYSVRFPLVEPKCLADRGKGGVGDKFMKKDSDERTKRSKKKGADEDASSAKMLTGLALELARKEAELRVQYGLGDDKAGGDPRRASKYGTARSSGAARSKR